MAERPGTPKRPPQVHSDERDRRAGGALARDDSAQAPHSNSGDPGRPRSTERSFDRRAWQLIVGRLQEHGRAPYQFRPDQDLSYYAKVLTTGGMRVIWGKDLERAIRAGETKPKLGDLIGARRVSREAVTLVDRRRDAEGNVLTQTEHHAHRTRWEVEKLQFFSERARRARLARDAHLETREAVRQRPELKSTFLSLRAAEELAAKRIRNAQDRERFLAIVREAIAASVQKGEPLPDIKLRERTRSVTQSTPASQSKKDREDPTR
nr:hypothetical protein [uncultured Steroidobacter sp.]